MNNVNKISIVIPSYNEAENITVLTEQIRQYLTPLNIDYEIIFVNDGSSDSSWEVICKLKKQYTQVKGIDLAGNYGQTIALRAGFNLASGDVIIAMDSDMQHDPKYIPKFVELISQGYDMVGGSKEKRPEGFITALMAKMAHKIICLLSGVKLSYFGATFKAYRAYLIKDLNLIGDAHRFMGALVVRKGIRFIEIPININKRLRGKSSYSFKKVFYVFIDLIFLKFALSYLNKPFRFFGVIGGLVSLVGVLLISWFVFIAFFFNVNINQNYLTEFVASVFLFLLGVILMSIGLLAEIGIYNYFAKDRQLPYNVRSIIS
ncbi:MAG: glycosyltransferase family 2 protein [Pseudomonadota bacterium]